MKRFSLIILFTSVCLFMHGQIADPVKWSFEQRTISKTEKELVFTAKIEHPWHIYGMNLPADGPVSTQFFFDKIKGATLVGPIAPDPSIVPIKKYDESFAMNLTWYESKAIFKQKIKISAGEKIFISGHLQYMCCDDKSCLPPKKENFSFGIEKSEDKDSSATMVAIPIRKINVDSVSKANTPKNYWAPVVDKLKSFGQDNFTTQTMSLWVIFFTGFVGGLLALFTPCVWPIIPMTVSFFLKRNNNKRKGRKEAIFYGLSIIFIYVTLGLLITLLFGASALNTISTNAVFNVIFFALLVIFAISFLGFFEITLPASWSTALNNKAEHTTGALSILLMASTLVIVSFSCTGPIIGTLLVQVSTSGSLLAPAVGMLGFALALSIPFSLFALFPAWLNAMPRSGSWLNIVKVALAFVELALALKFLSVADMTSGWNILSRNLFISLWIVFATGFGAYMLGLIRFPHDSKNQHINWIRRILALVAFSFVAYLACGFWGTPLKEISAFLPPMENKQEFHDFDKGMAYAQRNQMPVFVDFTGYGCVNCRKMEAAVFTDHEIAELMTRFVVINLYVDDRAPLEKPEDVLENGKPLHLETKGDKWSYLQRIKFGANAQPYYVMLDNEGNPISRAYAYNENIERFKAFLKQALNFYQKHN